jgi:hypothetical protein
MNQQINLYQAIFRQERKQFSLLTMALSLAVVAVALLVMWSVGVRGVDKLAAGVEQLKQQLAVQQQLAQSAGTLLDANSNPAVLQAKVQMLSARLAERTQALQLLQSGVAGEPKGFAPRLQALARQHTPGVWLDELLLGGGAVNGGMMLRGRSLDAESVPRFLQRLTGEPELAGTRFDEVVLDRKPSHEPAAGPVQQPTATVRFSVSSRTLLKRWREKGT